MIQRSHPLWRIPLIRYIARVVSRLDNWLWVKMWSKK